MPSIDCLDTIEINAEPSIVFNVISDYPNISKWLPIYRCELVDGNTVKEGCKVRHRYGHPPFILSDFTRQINKIVKDSLLEESYIDGDLRGTGVWRFEKIGDKTRASYHCKVNSNSWLTHISFLLLGNNAHSNTYKSLLNTLKTYCENL